MSIKICVNCRVEMRCKKTGCLTVWNKTHAYSGDEYECPSCNARFRVLANEAREILGALEMEECLPLDMTPDEKV